MVSGDNIPRPCTVLNLSVHQKEGAFLPYFPWLMMSVIRIISMKIGFGIRLGHCLVHFVAITKTKDIKHNGEI